MYVVCMYTFIRIHTVHAYTLTDTRIKHVVDAVYQQMKVIQHSVDTLHTALVSDCQDLAKLYRKYTKKDRDFLEEGLHPGQPGSLFQPITVHSDSDWISCHPEEPQSFERFYRDPNRRTLDTSHNTIYIQTIGEFSSVTIII